MKKYLYLPLITLTVLCMGLFLLNCNGTDDGCETDADCPQGEICNTITGDCVVCPPNCTGKCCGDDGCGGTCPDNCPTGLECNTQNCNCETPPDCIDDNGCQANECCQNQVCVAMSCGTLECGLDSVCQKECGPCTAPEVCNNGTCETPVVCTTEADCTDPNTQCCINQVCVDMACGTLECGPDPECNYECGPCIAPATCDNGECIEDICPLCPAGQECTQVGAGGSMGCVIPPDTVPDTNPTDCAANGCDGNYGCYCLDDTCSTSVCIENCGTCLAGTDCCEIWPGGPMGCFAGGTGCADLPANPPYCDQNTPCVGNAGCYTDGTNNFCIDHCSSDYCDCTNGETKCEGDTVQTCTNLVWVDTTDCTTTSQVCANGACITPPGLGEFCEDSGVCAAGLDCVGTTASAHSFCTPQCDCNDGTGCDAGWECLLGNGDPPTTCWCAKLCTTAADCPDAGGGGYTCEVLATDPNTGDDIYGCMIQ